MVQPAPRSTKFPIAMLGGLVPQDLGDTPFPQVSAQGTYAFSAPAVPRNLNARRNPKGIE